VAEAKPRPWRNGFGRVKIDRLQRLVEFKPGTSRRRKGTSDPTLDNLNVTEA
jgi:hypothetical protein